MAYPQAVNDFAEKAINVILPEIEEYPGSLTVSAVLGASALVGGYCATASMATAAAAAAAPAAAAPAAAAAAAAAPAAAAAAAPAAAAGSTTTAMGLVLALPGAPVACAILIGFCVFGLFMNIVVRK